MAFALTSGHTGATPALSALDRGGACCSLRRVRVTGLSLLVTAGRRPEGLCSEKAFRGDILSLQVFLPGAHC